MLNKLKRTRLIQKMDVIALEHPLPTVSNQTQGSWQYAGEKVGGTDIGHKVKDADGSTHLIKTGISSGLIGQILKHKAKNETDKITQKLGYIVDSYIRLANLQTSEKALIVQSLVEAFNAVCSTGRGLTLIRAIEADSKYNLGSSNVHMIAESMCQVNPTLQGILGLTSFSDIANGVISQHFVDGFQSQYLTADNVPSPTFIIDAEKRGYLGSKFVEGAIGLDTFLTEPFRKADGSFVSTAEDISERKLLLKNKIIENGGLNGLIESISLRLFMGENADNGPDNMLIKNGGIISIDLTGCRYDRSDDFKDKEGKVLSLGWKTIFAEENKNTFLDNILGDSVFKSRYVGKGNDHIHAAVLEVIKEVIGQEPALNSRTEIIEHLAQMDQDLTKASVAGFITRAAAALGEKAPSIGLLNSLTTRSQDFFAKAISFASSLARESSLNR